MVEGLMLTCPHCGQLNRVPVVRLTETARCGACHQAVRQSGTPLHVDYAGLLAQVLRESRVPVLVDFWASWCGPCRVTGPEVARVAARNPASLLVIKASTEHDPRVGRDHGVRTIPTLALFLGGRELSRVSGARPAEAIEAFVQQAISAAA